MEIEAGGLLARALQHEMDHLEGLLHPQMLSEGNFSRGDTKNFCKGNGIKKGNLSQNRQFCEESVTLAFATANPPGGEAGVHLTS